MPCSEVCRSVVSLRALSYMRVVIGERIVTPQALVHLVIKLRVSTPKCAITSEVNGNVDTENHPTIDTDEDARLDDAFLNSPRDVEDLRSPSPILDSAHSPLWPSVCYLYLPPIFLADVTTYSESQAWLVDCACRY